MAAQRSPSMTAHAGVCVAGTRVPSAHARARKAAERRGERWKVGGYPAWERHRREGGQKASDGSSGISLADWDPVGRRRRRQRMCGARERCRRRRNRDLARRAVNGRGLPRRCAEEAAYGLARLLEVVDRGRPRCLWGGGKYFAWCLRARGASRRLCGATLMSGRLLARRDGCGRRQRRGVKIIVHVYGSGVLSPLLPLAWHGRAKVSKVMARLATYWRSLRRSATLAWLRVSRAKSRGRLTRNAVTAYDLRVQLGDLRVRAAGHGGGSVVERRCGPGRGQGQGEREPSKGAGWIKRAEEAAERTGERERERSARAAAAVRGARRGRECGGRPAAPRVMEGVLEIGYASKKREASRR
ncbi:hypothetical protein ACSSS7_007910 [Eimeria intestinalis]